MICEICGKEFNKLQYNGTYENICSHDCFDAKFWNDNLDKDAIIINGSCYHVGDENSQFPFRGFAGRLFKIKMNDGTIITTTNLWHNGSIPKKRNIKDNAKFICEKTKLCV